MRRTTGILTTETVTAVVAVMHNVIIIRKHATDAVVQQAAMQTTGRARVPARDETDAEKQRHA